MSKENGLGRGFYSLPFRAKLAEYQEQAERLYDALQAGDDDARWNFKWMHPRYRGKSVHDVDAATLGVGDAQIVVAQEYAFNTWEDLAKFTEADVKAGKLVAPPLRKHFHVQIQIHATAKQPFDLGARGSAERLDGATALADDDPFLALALDIEHGPNIYRLGSLSKLVDLAGNAIRQFFVQQLKRGLPNEFGRKESHRLRRKITRIVVEGPFGEQLSNRGNERLDALSALG